jgi:hypothetical protein
MAEKDPLSEDDDGDEYELEPVDPEILARERERGEQQTRQAGAAVDVDQVYRETEATDLITWDDLQGFRFTIRHLLIATAVLAIVMTLVKIADCLGMFIVAVIALAVGWFFVLRKERRIRSERERRLAELGLPDAETLPAKAQAVEVSVAPAFRFSFSMKEMFIALTAAAVVFGLVRMLGGPENAAVVLGTIALVGLVVQLLGFEAPPLVILGWWLLLVLYIVVTLWAAFNSNGQAALPGP